MFRVRDFAHPFHVLRVRVSTQSLFALQYPGSCLVIPLSVMPLVAVSLRVHGSCLFFPMLAILCGLSILVSEVVEGRLLSCRMAQ